LIHVPDPVLKKVVRLVDYLAAPIRRMAYLRSMTGMGLWRDISLEPNG
jgi:hypothetical protein